MKAKHDYRLAVQEARTVRCSKLEELEAACSKAIVKNAAAKALYCAAHHEEHTKHMQELEEWMVDVENKKPS